MAQADGRILSDRKRQVLQHICNQLGVTGFNFHTFEQRSKNDSQYQHRYQISYTSHPRSQSVLNDAYQLLGISAQANDAELKKAYRRLMSQHHPDKLIANGLPPEMIKVTTQKTQQIKSAYETIRK